MQFKITMHARIYDVIWLSQKTGKVEIDPMEEKKQGSESSITGESHQSWRYLQNHSS